MNRWTWPGVVVVILAALGAFGAAPSKGSRVKNPHGAFEEECSLCHTADGWVPARVSGRFDHAKYGLLLEGAHKRTPCRSCHPTLDFARAQAPCAECHQDVHAGELGSDCASCHTTRSFIDRSRMERDHRLTRFPLNGVHATLDCETCHGGAEPGHLAFVNVSSECVSCHRPEYLAAELDHEGNGFSEDCSLCHGNRNWSGADFDHGGTGFPLTGAHAALECARCHGGGGFGGLSPACVSCHQSDYDGTTDPIHTTIGFSTDCASCHGTSTWNGARFDHNRFPIYSGAHQGRWNACTDCHGNPASYLEFSCLGCHPHSDQTETNGHHREVANYVYESQACYSCHPGGRAE